MTAQEIIARIKAEVERLYDEANNYDDSRHYLGEVLSSLSDLEKECEKPSDGLEEEIERYLHSLGVGYGGWVDGMEDDDLRGIARHFARWGAEHLDK